MLKIRGHIGKFGYYGGNCPKLNNELTDKYCFFFEGDFYEEFNSRIRRTEGIPIFTGVFPDSPKAPFAYQVGNCAVNVFIDSFNTFLSVINKSRAERKATLSKLEKAFS